MKKECEELISSGIFSILTIIVQSVNIVTENHLDFCLSCVRKTYGKQSRGGYSPGSQEELWDKHGNETLWKAWKKKDQRCRKEIQSQLLQLMMELSLSSGRKSSIALIHFKTASLVPQTVKTLTATWETQVQSLGWEDPLEKGMATHSSILAWRSPLTEGPGRL